MMKVSILQNIVFCLDKTSLYCTFAALS
uniref:Uncharacterized protein n=1 Tax=Anguilla anguilla TaxID=7936 RepID=A0A0E9U9R7_ANGAN